MKSKKVFWAYLILSFGQGNPMMVRLMGPIKKTKQHSAETHLSCSPSTSTLLSSFCNILGYSSIRGWHQLGTYSSTIWPLSHPDMHRISKSFLLPVPSEAPACSPQGHQCSCYWGRGTPGWQSFFADSVQTEYCPTFLLSVCPSVTGVTSHISHIYKGINAMLIIRDPSTPIYSESKSSWLSF